MNIIDIALIIILIMAAITGYKKGVIKEAVSFIGIIIIFVIAFTFKESLGNTLCKYAPFFTFSGNIKGLVSLNILFYQLLAFFIIYSVLFAIYQIVLKISGIFQKIINWTIILAFPSHLGGAIISVLGVYIILFTFLLGLNVPLKTIPIVKDSVIIDTIIHKTPLLSTYTKGVSNTIADVYELTDDLVNNKLNVNEANQEIINIMLKYDVVSVKTVEQLIVLDKLKTVKGLEVILEEYK